MIEDQRKFRTSKGTYYSREALLKDYGISIATYYRRKKDIVIEYIPPQGFVYANIEDKVYSDSPKALAKHYGVHPNTIRYRCRINKGGFVKVNEDDERLNELVTDMRRI